MQDMPLTWTQKAMTRLGGATKWVGKQFRLLGAAIMKAIVPIAIIVIAIGAAVAIWDMFWNTKEQKAYNEGMKELDTLLGEIEEKVQKMHKAMNNTINLADGQNRAFEIQSGLLTELVDKMKELIKLREEANKSRPGGDDDANRGILICGSGQGMAMVANKHKGIRAALCVNEEMVELARAHNDANVLTIGARLIDESTAISCVDKFFSTPFEGDRHIKRVNKIG